MKVVILAGGYGSRLFEETISKPKPMVNIGGIPILCHIMKIYSSYGLKDFIICLGYKKEVIIEYFINNTDHFKSFSGISGAEYVFRNTVDDWNVTLVDTGIDTMTGGRLKKVKHLINDSTFLLSYGDTISNVQIDKTIELHQREKSLITLTAVQPQSNYGVLLFEEDKKTIHKFVEKPKQENQWINGGFYVMDSEILDYIEDDKTSLECEPFTKVVEQKKLSAYKHKGFWKSIETYKDKLELEEMWNINKAEWNIWEQELGKAL